MNTSTNSLNVPPGYWEEFHHDLKQYHRVWRHKVDGLTVLRSISTMANGEKWVHVSVSRRSRMPSWDDLSKIKRDFLGEDVEAYQVMAKAADHVNVHQFCLHLWAPIDGRRIVANLQDIILEEGV